jgi:hypothetical protein
MPKQVVSHEEWLKARCELLAAKKKPRRGRPQIPDGAGTPARSVLKRLVRLLPLISRHRIVPCYAPLDTDHAS